MQVPKEATALAMYFEGLRLSPYLCPAGYPTIGYGHLCKADQGPITPKQAEALLQKDLALAMKAVLRLCPVLKKAPSGRLAAIIDFTFNLGAGHLENSTLRRRINQNEWDAVPDELRKWVYARSVKLSGLVARREAEIILL
jgi:lysozyme